MSLNPLDPFLDALGEGRPTQTPPGTLLRYATVTGVNPLRVQFDGESSATAASPGTIVGVRAGDRVLVAHHGRTQMTILGKLGGIPEEPRDADYWTSGIVPASGSSEVTDVRIAREGRIVTVQARITGVSVSTGANNLHIATITRSAIRPTVLWTPWASGYLVGTSGLIDMRSGEISVRWSSGQNSNLIIYFAASWVV